MLMKDWHDAVKTMTVEELKAKRAALIELLKWQIFKDAYQGYGVEVVLVIIEVELESR